MSEPLRIVIVNHVHPQRPHVSALRMRMFAEHLSKRGDKVVLLSDRYDSADTGTSPAVFPDLVRSHDWSAPLSVATAPAAGIFLSEAREGKLPLGLRQGVIAWSYFMYGGIFKDWRDAAAPLGSTIARIFQPDITLATFGNTDAWAIAEMIAKEAGSPWIGDFKDSWSHFIPSGFRRRTARRFAGMAHMTTFSSSHRLEASRWFSTPMTVIYSGHDNAGVQSTGMSSRPGRDIVLSGSLYGLPHVDTLYEGVRRFVTEHGRADIRLIYAGNDGRTFERTANVLAGICETEDLGYLPADELASLQARALANVYVFNPRSLFQQKVLELFAANRPVIAIPGESDEAADIALQVGGILHRTDDPESVAAALRTSVDDRPVLGGAIEAYSWAAQTNRLREVMLSVIETAR